MGPVTSTLNVTATDIKLGQRKDDEFCPLARAAARNYTNTVNLRILVTPTHINVWNLKAKNPRPWILIEKYALPEEAIAFIADFDAGRPVAPFTVEIEVPQR